MKRYFALLPTTLTFLDLGECTDDLRASERVPGAIQGHARLLDQDQMKALKARITSALALAPWDNADIQYPRLVASMLASQAINTKAVADHMGVTPHALNNLLQRAFLDWEAARAKLVFDEQPAESERSVAWPFALEV